jgi:ribosomal protein S18 acetylase RimI-like enzyme
VAGDTLQVRLATPGDVALVLELLDEAARWSATIGQPNWPAPFPSKPVARDAGAGHLHVAALGAEVVGTLVLRWEDPKFWGPDGTDNRAGYVHRLAVRRAHAGAGLGARLMAWADEQVRAAGRTCVRLDVVSRNEPLRRYYEGHGFGYVRDVGGEWVHPDGTREPWCTSLYERPVS